MRRRWVLLVVWALCLPPFLAACGGSGGGSDGGDDRPPAATPTPGVDPTAPPSVAPTAPPPVDPNAPPPVDPNEPPVDPNDLPNTGGIAGIEVFVATSDFQTGSFATFALDAPAAVTRNVAQIHSDAVAREHDGIVYVVNRLGADNIQALDPRAGFATLWQCSVGNGANPHDIVFAAPDKAYVTLYGRSTLAIVDPTAGPSCAGFLRGSIDLAPLADADGLPEMDQGIIVGGRLYVTVQRLSRANFFQPTDRSEIAVIDVATDTLVDVDPSTTAIDGIRLSATNPFSGSHGLTLDPATGKILVGSVGNFGVIGDGGIERVDPATNRAEGLFVTESGLGGNVTDFAFLDARRAYAIVFARSGSNTLVRFDPSTGVVAAELAASREFLVDVELDPSGTLLLLTDRTLFDPGIRLFRTADDTEVTAAPVDTGLPPFDVVFLRGGASGGITVAPGFYVGTTSEGEDISLDVASVGTVFFTCGGRTVQADPGGAVDGTGRFAVTVGGIALTGQFRADGTVSGTLQGAGCAATFTATRRPGAGDADGDRVPDAVDPDFGIVCGDGVPEGQEECDDGNQNDADACLSTCRQARCGDGVVRTGVEECDGDDAPCAVEDVCAADCVCRAPEDACTATIVTVRLTTPQPLGSGTLVLDYPEVAVAIPGSGNAPSVRARVEVLTTATLFSGGAPNDQDDRILFTLFASDGVGTGPLLAVTFDCLSTPPAAAAFTCRVDDASTPALQPIAGVTCSLAVESRRE